LKYLVWATTALIASTALTQAGGIERNAQSVGILFEEGTYAELGFAWSDPDVSGTWSVAPVSSGDMAPAYLSTSLSYRMDLTDQLSFAFIMGDHVGADANYPTGTGYPVGGSTAELNGMAYTALLRYEFRSNVSVYGGLRISQLDGEVSLPWFGPGYTVSGDAGTELGYVVGAAYERPDIALRVSLTYSSAIDHTWQATETLGVATATTFETTIPQSLNLEFQSGVAENTLVFGSIRWVDWSEFEITPTVYTGATAGGSLVNYTDDRITYTLGVGRRFNENWAGAISVVHEPSVGGQSGNLGPTDGRNAVGVGLTYENDRFEISGGVQYSWLGDTFTVPAAGIGTFSDNTAISAGLRIGIRF
jgi:long-chain fatty acid transport protein